MDEATRTYIITELGKQRARRDVIFELCNQHGVDWKEAEKWVRSVELFDSKQVAARQSPLLIILGGGVLLIGLALTVYAVVFFWGWIQLDSIIKLAQAQAAYGMGVLLVTGLAMSTGGIIGLRRILADML